MADIGLSMAHDQDIWAYAQTHGAVLVTKDEDFVTMRASRRDGPPVVWIRLGNTTRRVLLNRFIAIQDALISALEKGETVVEVSSS